MCGINGLFYFNPQRNVEEHLLTNMRQVATHRGPDDHGIFRHRNVGLGFNRLSIIDLAGGHQPMTNDDGSAWIVFNGEIYNFVELRSELVRAGYQFHTNSDTEVILRAWEEYGEDCVTRLRGMFAFAIYDQRQKVLFGARDRVGIKPFYYYADSNMFAFASEIKSLLEIPEIPRQVDGPALADYLRHGYVVTPHTVFRDIVKLPPAHTITVNLKGITLRRYWDFPLEPARKVDDSQALEEFSSILDEAVGSHLMSDVPLGVFLSGGLDSSTLVAVMSRLGVNNIQTFSVGYDSGESELDYARVVAKHYRTEHHEIRLTPSEFCERLPKIVWHMDEPVADAPSIPFYCLAEFARRTVTVALSGEGADEILGGYPTYRRMLRFDSLNRMPLARLVGQAFERFAPPGKLRKNASMLGKPLESRYRAAVIFSVEEISRLLPHEPVHDDPYSAFAKAYARCENFDSLTRMSYLDLNTWLPNDLLVKADRMSMAHSLELRVPFLDHKLMEFAARLPQNLKIRGNMSKYILKQLMEPLLPANIIHSAKRGFPIPTKAWFRNGLSGFARETLLAADSPCLAFLSKQEVARVLDAHRYRDCSLQIYALLVFDEWYRTFIKSTRGAGSVAGVRETFPA